MSESQSKKWYEPILDWLKLNGGQATIDFILANGGTWIATAIGGFWGKVVSLFYKILALPLLKRLRNKLQNEAEEKEKLEKYKEEISKEQTDEERVKSESDFLGG